MNKIFVLIFLSFVASCVGTIEETAQTKVTVEAPSSVFTFEGVRGCEAVSHDKIDVIFNKAAISVGQATEDELIYRVFVDGNFARPLASKVAADMSIDHLGFYHLIVSGLSINVKYSVTVRVQDPITGQSDANKVACNVRTLDEKFPNFKGLKSISNYPGILGQSTLTLSWVEAEASEFIVGTIPKAEYAISNYKIYKGSDPDKLTLFTELPVVPGSHPISYNVGGLISGDKYYFRVNAVDASGREEKNVVVLSKETLKSSSISFAGVASVDTPESSAGYNSLDVEWNVGSGDFDAYKIFVFPDGAVGFSSGPSHVNDHTFLSLNSPITNTTTAKISIPGLEKNVTYAIYVVACKLADASNCDMSSTPAGAGVGIKGTTTPKLSPFGGITSIDPLDGVTGLSQAYINWNPPSKSGVCSRIVLRESIDPTGELPICPNASGPCISQRPNCEDEQVIVQNLTLDKVYCLEAVVEAEGLLQDSLIVSKCVEPSFQKPVFQNAFSCDSANTGEFDITWVTPSPKGMFDQFLILYKLKSESEPTDNRSWWELGKTAFESGDNTSFKWEVVSSSTLAKKIVGKIPGSTYRFIVKTILQSNGDYFYDDNLIVKNCTAKGVEMTFGGWDHIMALGPNQDHTGAVVKEEMQEVLHNSGKHFSFVYESTDGSDEGIVYLKWDDFKMTDGTKLSESLVDYDLDPTVDGFYIFRTEVPVGTVKEQILNQVNTISEISPGWVKVNSTPVALDPFSKKATYIDHLSGNIHPVKENSVSLTDYEKGERGKVVWYHIKFSLNGRYLPFAEGSSLDSVVDVILPPANMALIHRNISNKNLCTIIGQTAEVDRDNFYRCPFQGLGSIQDPDDGNFYLDVKGHSLVNRDTLKCNDTNRVDNSWNSVVWDTRSAKKGDVVAMYNSSSAPTKARHCIMAGEDFSTLDTLASTGIVTPPTSQAVIDFTKSTFSYGIVRTELGPYDQFYESTYNQALLGGLINITNANQHGYYFFDTTQVLKYLITTAPTGLGAAEQACLASNSCNGIYLDPDDGYVYLDAYKLCGYNSTSTPPTGCASAYVSSNGIGSGTYALRPVGGSIFLYGLDGHVSGVQSKETSIFPAKVDSEILGRTYSFNDPVLYPFRGTGKKWFINEPVALNHPSFPYTFENHSLAHYACESQTFKVKRGGSYGPNIRKRILSSVEYSVMELVPEGQSSTSLVPPKRRRDTQTSLETDGYNQYGVTFIPAREIYLAAQALCSGGSGGVCYTNPASGLVSDYNLSTGALSTFPLYAYTPQLNKFPGQSFMTNGRGNDFFFNVFDSSLYLTDNSNTPSDIHFGLPYKMDLDIDLDMKDYHFSPLIGLPLWCAQGSSSCHTDDFLNFPSGVQYQGRYSIKADDGTFLSNSSYIAPAVLKTDVGTTYRYNSKWVSHATPAEGLCSVKLELDLAGNIRYVDDHEVD